MEVVLHQGRIETFFLDHIKKHSRGAISVERAVLPESLQIDEAKCGDHSEHPITVKLRHLTEEEARPPQLAGTNSDGLFRSNLTEDDTDSLIQRSREKEGLTEIVRAKYLVGCDGAHSWTRRQLGFEMQGEATDHIWAVLGTQWNLLRRYLTNNQRRHPNYGLPRHPFPMRGPQREFRQHDGDPAREQVGPTIYPTYGNQTGCEREG